MAALPYIQLYVADYLSDTMHLETDEHGAYLLLIMNYWQTGKPINQKHIKAITQISNERYANVIETLQQFFNVDDNGMWFHKRIEADLEKVREKSTKASDAGKKSAESRWKNKGKITDVIANVIANVTTDVTETLQRNCNHTETETETETETDKEENQGHCAKNAQSPDANAPAPAPEKQKSKTVKPEKPTPYYETVELPDFIDREMWLGWQRERKERFKSKAAYTEFAINQHLLQLTELQNEGFNANAALVLIRSSVWQGVNKNVCVEKMQAQKNPLETGLSLINKTGNNYATKSGKQPPSTQHFSDPEYYRSTEPKDF